MDALRARGSLCSCNNNALLMAATRMRCLYASALLLASFALAQSKSDRLPPAYCYDRKTDCANWARDKECEGKNQEFMHATCPLSCGMCSQRACDDKSPNCPKMHLRGDCESRPKTTLKACSTSCGVCTVRCVDQHTDCPVWASEGECNEHADFMTEACPISCGTCTRACVDRHDDCPGWTAEGQCWKNPAFMYDMCPRSCGVCPGSETCEDDADQSTCKDSCKDRKAECADWKDHGQCKDNPTAVAKDCPESCGLCTHLCIDQYKHCREWAKEGACESNHAYMLNKCPAACGTCARIKAAMQFGDGPDWPTEAAPVEDEGAKHEEL